MRTRRAASLLLVSLAASCVADAPPRAQWLVRVSTDAPVPQLGDSVLVELLTEDGSAACGACSRSFGFRSPNDWPLSFGITDPGDGHFRLRVRLFRGDHATGGGLPLAGLPLDVIGALPATTGGIRRVKVELLTACAGVPADVATGLTCDPAGGPAKAHSLADDDGHATLEPGSSPLAQTTPCKGPAPEGMVCVPGGLFVLGRAFGGIDVEPKASASPERLVRLPAFALDATEMTVAQMRALVRAGRVAAPTARGEAGPSCTFTETEGPLDRHPVNCVTYNLGESACAALGKRFPTEAEWEFAAGNRTDETTYPWGEDEDYCHLAIVGRGRALEQETTTCLEVLAREGAAVAEGTAFADEGADVTLLGIRHLGGNVSEWVSDYAHGYEDTGCLGPARVLVAPSCTVAPSQQPLLAKRGGSWASHGNSAQSTARYPADRGDPMTGFRCAMDM
jgi:formylglycine-generating enzyme required for sulfatase activity